MMMLHICNDNEPSKAMAPCINEISSTRILCSARSTAMVTRSTNSCHLNCYKSNNELLNGEKAQVMGSTVLHKMAASLHRHNIGCSSTSCSHCGSLLVWGSSWAGTCLLPLAAALTGSHAAAGAPVSIAAELSEHGRCSVAHILPG